MIMNGLFTLILLIKLAELTEINEKNNQLVDTTIDQSNDVYLDNLAIYISLSSVNQSSANLEYIFINRNTTNDGDDQFDMSVQQNFNKIYLTNPAKTYKIINFYYKLNGFNNYRFLNDTLDKTATANGEFIYYKNKFNLNNLNTSAYYNVKLVLEYRLMSDGGAAYFIHSNTIEFYTYDKCNCKLNNTLNDDLVNCVLNNCTCKPYYDGISCEKCAKYAYYNENTQQCEPCPCEPTIKSSGECSFEKNVDSQMSYVKCNQCYLPYIGVLCEQCDSYYYKHSNGLCLPCMCNGNTSPLAKQHCHNLTGDCIDCVNNTSGKNCEKCLDGYVGNALNQSCVSYEDSKKVHSNDDSSNTKLIISNTTPPKHEPMNTKGLFLLTFIIFTILMFILLIVYLFNNFKFNSNQAISSSNSFIHRYLLNPFTKFINNLQKRRSHTMATLKFKRFNNILNRNFHNIYKNNSNGGSNSNGNSISNNDDDDDNLNLAENQVIDDSIFTDDFYIANQPSAVNNSKINGIQQTNNKLTNSNATHLLLSPSLIPTTQQQSNFNLTSSA